MKIVHFADAHYGVDNYGRVDPGTGLHTRTLDLNSTMDGIVGFVAKERVDVVLFAGDAYKTRHPTPTQQREFSGAMRALADRALVVMVPGNHDLPGSPTAAHTLDVFSTLANELRFLIMPEIQLGVMCSTKGDLQVISLPWPDPRWLLEDWRSVPTDELHGRILAEITTRLDRAYAQVDPSLPVVLVGHVAMMGGATLEASERTMTFGWHPYLSPAVLEPERFDYVALGHHHRQQQLAENVFYSGSLQRIDFGEEADAKGFMYLELDAAKPLGQRIVDGPRFVELNVRRFVTIEVAPKEEDPMLEIHEGIDGQRESILGPTLGKDAIVRVILELNEEQSRRVDEAAIHRHLADAHHVAAIQRMVDRPERRRADAAVETMTPLDALDAYWRTQETSDERRREMVTATGELLRSVEAPAVKEEVAV